MEHIDDFFFKRVNPSFNKLHYEKVSLEKRFRKKSIITEIIMEPGAEGGEILYWQSQREDLFRQRRVYSNTLKQKEEREALNLHSWNVDSKAWV